MKLVKELRAIGAVQVILGDFSCVFSPPDPFGPPLGAVIPAPPLSDGDQEALKEAQAAAQTRKKMARDRELYGAAENGGAEWSP